MSVNYFNCYEKMKNTDDLEARMNHAEDYMALMVKLFERSQGMTPNQVVRFIKKSYEQWCRLCDKGLEVQEPGMFLQYDNYTELFLYFCYKVSPNKQVWEFKKESLIKSFESLGIEIGSSKELDYEF